MLCALRSRIRDYYIRFVAEQKLKMKKRWLLKAMDGDGEPLVKSVYMWYNAKEKKKRRYKFKGPTYVVNMMDHCNVHDYQVIRDEVDYALNNFKGIWNWYFTMDIEPTFHVIGQVIMYVDHPDDAFWLKMSRFDYEEIAD